MCHKEICFQDRFSPMRKSRLNVARQLQFLSSGTDEWPVVIRKLFAEIP